MPRKSTRAGRKSSRTRKATARSSARKRTTVRKRTTAKKSTRAKRGCAKRTVRKVKKVVRKAATRKTVKKATARKMLRKKKVLVGRVSHFFNKINVSVVELSAGLKVGDKISVEGATTKFSQKVKSMQIERVNVTSAKARDSIGLKIENRVRNGDRIYRI